MRSETGCCVRRALLPGRIEGILEPAPVRQPGQGIGPGQVGEFGLHRRPAAKLAPEHEGQDDGETAERQDDGADDDGLRPPRRLDLLRGEPDVENELRIGNLCERVEALDAVDGRDRREASRLLADEALEAGRVREVDADLRVVARITHDARPVAHEQADDALPADADLIAEPTEVRQVERCQAMPPNEPSGLSIRPGQGDHVVAGEARDMRAGDEETQGRPAPCAPLKYSRSA